MTPLRSAILHLPPIAAERDPFPIDPKVVRRIGLKKPFLAGGRDSNASGETARNTEKRARSEGAKSAQLCETVEKVQFRDPLATSSRPFAQRVAELEAAIASVTRALGVARDEAVGLLVRECAAMRAELCALALRDGAAFL